ncbi:hypothetical protein PsorP6_012922 [Peronosclerospora sorghi]|uniref:Uncharacterized protein n=1 Tax=Peronosclerospora sorghi TaxID=230839 RepID=A0ACC0WIR4_9STRA|nr:hypothetical protein PsorP6_012922 [Peronosclerospora sorghi]
MEHCTRGTWLWDQPQKNKMDNGKDVWVLMLDMEVRLANSLATLLCSKLIYNSQGSVDEKSINGLRFIGNLAKHIKVSASARESEDEYVMQFHSFFPSFLDFTLELVDEDGNLISSSECLERALADQTRTPANMERNRIDAMTKDFFPQRDWVTLVCPVHDDKKLEQADALPIKDLRPDFWQQLLEVKQIVYGENLQPKMVQGIPLNGGMFAGLLQAYVAIINSGGVPAIKNSEKRPLTYYHAAAIGYKALDLEDNLLKCMEGVKATCVRNNAAHSKEMWDRFLQVHYDEKIQPKLASVSDDESGGFADMQQFSREWLTFRDAYLKKDRGGTNLECLFCGKN